MSASIRPRLLIHGPLGEERFRENNHRNAITPRKFIRNWADARQRNLLL